MWCSSEYALYLDGLTGCRWEGLAASGLYVTWIRTTSSESGDTEGGWGVARGVEWVVDGARCMLKPQMPELKSEIVKLYYIIIITT